MVTIKNSEIAVTIAKRGAEIQSIKRGEVEYMWSRDPQFWTGSAPIMFPICGGLNNGKYTLDGKTYEMSKHGFARRSDFEIESLSETSVTFILRDSEKTREIYPYSFAFRVAYTLEGASLKVTYDAENLDNKIMYCTFGAHEGYACPEGIEEYDVIFEKKETLVAYGLNGDILTDYTKQITDNSDTLPLDDKYFVLDALVFRDVKSNCVTLKHKHTDRYVKVDFDGFDYLLIWHKHTAPYICIEPWCGLQDIAGANGDFREKEGMRALGAGEHFTRTHIITVG